VGKVSDWLKDLLGVDKSKGDKILRLLGTLIKQGEQIMATLAQLQASLDAQTEAVQNVQNDVGVVVAEVDDLIAKLKGAGVPDAVLAQAQGTADKLSAIHTALQAIPPAP